MRQPYHYAQAPDAFSLRAQFQLSSFSSSKKHHQRPYQSSSRKHHSHSHHHRSQHHQERPPTYYDPPYSSKKTYLTTLPPELRLLIHESLDPITSTCLGLSSREFYPTHRSLHRRVGLYDRAEEGNGVPLCMYLRDWAPDEYDGLDWRSERLVRRRREDRDREREREKEREKQKRRERERGKEKGRGERLRRVRGCERLDVEGLRWRW